MDMGRFVRKDSLFPKVSRNVAAVLAFLAVTVLSIMEYAVLPHVSESGRIDADEWQKDVDRVNASYSMKNPSGKNSADEDWVWGSAAYKVPYRREKNRRILVLGDSFVWGSGGITNMNNLSWRQLERELRRRGYADVEVIAAGRSGASTRREFRALPAVVDRYKPDLVVWLYVTNDPDEGVVKQFSRTAIDEDSVHGWHLNMAGAGIFPRINRQLAGLRKKKFEATMPPEQVGYEYTRWEMEILKGENLRKYEGTIAEVASWSRRNGVSLFFTTVPNYPSSDYFAPRYAAVEPLFRKEGIPFYDNIKEFALRYPNAAANLEEWRASPADGHPGHKACRFHAEKIADVLEGKYPDSLGRRSKTFVPEVWINDWFPEDMEVIGRSQAHIKFKYPASIDRMPRMPVGGPYVVVNFRDPISIERIAVSGPTLETSQIYLSGEDPGKIIESGALFRMKKVEGRRAEWSLVGYPWKHCVDSIRIQAGFGGRDRTLMVEFR
jgi:lysophospholipase L1-like esterase